MSNMEITNCNQCPNQCPKEALKCGRGRRYFEQLEAVDGRNDENGEGGLRRSEGERGYGEGHAGHGGIHKHHGGSESGHGHGRPDDLYGLMRACGHYLHHNYRELQGQEEPLFAALDETEQETLKRLLKKLASSWEQ